MTSLWLSVILIALIKFSTQAAAGVNDTLSTSTAGVYNFTVTTNIPVTITAITPTLDYNVMPNPITIQPIVNGKATVVFTIRVMDISFLPQQIRVCVLVPLTTFLGVPLTGPASKVTKFSPGQNVVISGTSRTLTRTFFGFSVQTFTQLTGAILADQWTFINDANVTQTNYTRFDYFPIPTIIN